MYMWSTWTSSRLRSWVESFPLYCKLANRCTLISDFFFSVLFWLCEVCPKRSYFTMLFACAPQSKFKILLYWTGILHIVVQKVDLRGILFHISFWWTSSDNIQNNTSFEWRDRPLRGEHTFVWGDLFWRLFLRAALCVPITKWYTCIVEADS